MAKLRDMAIKIYVWAIAHRKTMYRVAAIIAVVVGVLIITTGQLHAAGVDDMYTKTKDLLGGALGKTIAILAFIGGIIALFFGNIQMGILAILGALLIAFGPAIIDTIFG